MKHSAAWGSKIKCYLVLGLVFWLWESLANSILGIYHFEVRRTLWGIVYYSLFFLLFGGSTEALSSLYGRLFPRSQWQGQKTIWFLALLLMVLWGDLSRQLLIHSFGILSVRDSYLWNLACWLPLTLCTACLVNVFLARWNRHRRFSDAAFIALGSAFGLYLILSTKAAYLYFDANPLAPGWLLLQALLGLAALAIFWCMMKWSSSVCIFRRWRFALPLVLTICLATLLPRGNFMNAEVSPRAPTSPNRPNIVVLVFDALRDDHVGPERTGRSLTPTMDSLTAAGRRYPVCRSVSSWTFPSVVALLTSRFPLDLGLIEPQHLPTELPTVAGLLQEQGYYTAALTANDLIIPKLRFDRTFDEFHFLRGRGPLQLFLPFRTFLPSPRILEELAFQFGFISTNLIAADWRQMNQQAEQLIERNSAQPLFLYMHYIEPHSPYWAAPFDDGLLDLQHLKWQSFVSFPSVREWLGGNAFIAAENPDLLVSEHHRYEGGVRVADGAVADLLQSLGRLGVADNTILVITADHGEEFMEHDHVGHKHSLYEEAVRTPLIIYVPPKLHMDLPEPRGDVSIMDIGPTICDLAGAYEEIPDCDGRSLLDTEASTHPISLMAVKVNDVLWRGVVAGSYKLIIRSREEGVMDTLLFDLAADREETQNLCLREPALAESLAAYLRTEFDRPGRHPSILPTTLTAEEISRLRALGYTD